jgi:octaprenyl-diphosphate synthase
MNSALLSATDLKAQIQQHLSADLQGVNQIIEQSLHSPSSFVANVLEHVSRYRGKQIRPILLLLMNRMVAGTATRKGQTLAAAIEMIHMATLVHDDVIDEAETRRHVATVHRRWNTETSVLLGDFLFSRAFHLSATTGDPSACVLIGKATDRICEGELNQIAARLEGSNSEVDYFRIVRGKTGQLFALSCQLGVASAGGSAEECKAAWRFGVRLGTAFQIADDALDVTQSLESTGKDAGNDLKNGRRTLPVLRALQTGATDSSTVAQDELRILNEWLRGERLVAPTEFRQIGLMQRGVQSALDTAEQLVGRAIRDLRSFAQSTDRQILEAIAGYAVRREN